MKLTTKLATIPAGLSLAVALTIASTMATATDEWEFSLAPLFLWGVSIEGDATIDGKTAPLDLDFQDDVLEHMEEVLTLHFEARRDDWTLFAEYQYLDLAIDVQGSQGPINADVDIDFDTTMWELGAAWALSETPETRWELIFGGRYTDHDVKVDADISSPLPDLKLQAGIDAGDDWWHAFSGVRVFQSMSDNWTFVGRVDYGYGGSDNSAINLAGIFDYRFRDWGSAFVGYKHLEYDYQSSNYGYDAKQRGPLIGLNLYW